MLTSFANDSMHVLCGCACVPTCGCACVPTCGSQAVNNKTKPHGFSAATATGGIGAGIGGGMSMNKCNAQRLSQYWNLTLGNTTSIKSDGYANGCWEITGCGTGTNAPVGTGYGCKSLPSNETDCDANPCLCNGAWIANPNGTISSVMDGNCFQTEGSHVSVGPCVAGSPKQKFEIKPKGGWYSPAKPPNSYGQEYTITQNGLCVDSNVSPPPPGPPPPMPGPGGASDVAVKLSDLALGFEGSVRVRDVWNHADLAPLSTDGVYKATVPYHGSKFLILMPAGTEWPLPFSLAPWMQQPVPPTEV